jgi:hypothetical protein
LLHYDPLAVVGDDETVEIEIEPVLHGGAIDFGDQPAGLCKPGAIHADKFADREQFAGRLSRMPAASAADVNAQLARQRLQPAFERAEYAGGDAGGMPIHSHHSAEGLEPEGVRKAAQEFVTAVLMDDGFRDDRAQAAHPLRQPFRNVPAMQR